MTYPSITDMSGEQCCGLCSGGGGLFCTNCSFGTGRFIAVSLSSWVNVWRGFTVPDNYCVDNAFTSSSFKMQEKIVDQFCKRHNLSNQAHLLPKADSVDTECLYRHLLINDKTGTLFCFVPKAGCTNLKLLFFVAQGTLYLERNTFIIMPFCILHPFLI